MEVVGQLTGELDNAALAQELATLISDAQLDDLGGIVEQLHVDDAEDRAAAAADRLHDSGVELEPTNTAEADAAARTVAQYKAKLDKPLYTISFTDTEGNTFETRKSAMQGSCLAIAGRGGRSTALSAILVAPV